MLSQNWATDAIQRVVDCGCIVIAYFIALQIASWLDRKGLFIFPEQWNYQYGAFLTIALLGWTAIASYRQIYGSHRAERFDFAALRLLRTLTVWAMVTTAGVFLLKLAPKF